MARFLRTMPVLTVPLLLAMMVVGTAFSEGCGPTSNSTTLYVYDAYGHAYWQMEDGSRDGDPAETLDPATITVCTYQVHHQATWTINNIGCVGYADNNQYTYLMVSVDDPRFTGDGIPGSDGWEYHVLTIEGAGNIVQDP